MNRVLYFGCWRDVGHYIWTPDRGRSLDCGQTPWGYSVDGKLQKRGGKVCRGEGIPDDAMLHHEDGWTAFAFWDRTVDRRPGSCSVFLATGEHSREGMLNIARETFPEIWDRLHPQVQG